MSKYARIAVILTMSLILAFGGCTSGPPPSEGPSEPPPPPTPTPSVSSKSGILTEISGSITTLIAGSADWTEAKVGMLLETGDRIRTGTDSMALITFFEGSTLELQSDTEVGIEELSVALETGSTTISIIQTIGKTTNRVVKLVDPASRYEVDTPSGSAVVRGTEFAVWVLKEDIVLPDETVLPKGTTVVSVSRGSVRAKARGVEREVNADEQTTILPGEAPSVPMPISEEEEGGPVGGGGTSRPRADFVATPTYGAAPLTVQFVDRSRGKITAWRWDFGDGTTSTDRHPTHTYSAPGSYTVSLTGFRDSRSDTETKSSYIIVYPPGGANSTVIIGEVVPP